MFGGKRDAFERVWAWLGAEALDQGRPSLGANHVANASRSISVLPNESPESAPARQYLGVHR